MMSVFLSLLDSATRRVFAAISLACVSMLAFGLFLQFHYNIEPCPMCIVQRDALLMVAIIAALTSASGKKVKQIWGASLLFISAVFGAFVAARQSWLQWYPPEIATCGRDFYGSRAAAIAPRSTGRFWVARLPTGRSWPSPPLPCWPC